MLWIPIALLALLAVIPARAADETEAGDSPRAGAAEDLVEIEVLRRPEALIETPHAVSVVSREEIRPSRPAQDLSEALDLVPGVFPQSSRNYAQDTRVSIRGFGARAPFGIRGIRVLVDGIPTTLPDGQSEVDSVDLAFVERLEIVRSPISSLYGGGGGGILALTTLEPTETPTVSMRTLFGSHDLSRYELTARGGADRTGWVLGVARTRQSGYRDHARSEQTVALAKLRRNFGAHTSLALLFTGVWAPEGQDPGALRESEVSSDRRAARPQARLFDTGEKLHQQKLAFSLRRALGPGSELRLVGYRLARDFSNALPFLLGSSGNGGRIDFSRAVTGGSLVYTRDSAPLRLLAGIDVDVQQDRRRRYANLFGSRGAMVVRQSETVRSFGPFAQAQLSLPNGVELVGGLRWDWTEFDVGDRIASPEDLSDTVRFRELSPRFGVRLPLGALQLYANVSTAFQVPTTTELKPPDRPGGLDSSREAERALVYELGAKGELGDRVHLDAALFDIRVRDALVPFEDSGGQVFFRNAGEVRRRGAELALSAALRAGLSLRAAYTYADYRYRDYDPESGGSQVDLDGKREPNVPMHSLAGELRWVREDGFFGVLSLRHFSDLELDDANRDESAGATLSDLRIGYRSERGRVRLQPFFGVRNWSGSEFDGTVRPNASRSFGPPRYFEPAPELEIYGGIQVELRGEP